MPIQKLTPMFIAVLFTKSKSGNIWNNQAAAAAAAAAKSLQSCLTLCDPTDGSPPGSPVPGILQARTLEWVAISFSNAWKWKWSRSVVSDFSRPHGLQPTRLLHLWYFPGKSTGVGCHSSINWLNKQNVVYAYSGVLFKHKKKWGTDTCSNTAEPWKYYARWKQPHIVCFHLCELFRLGNSTETESTVLSVFSRS